MNFGPVVDYIPDSRPSDELLTDECQAHQQAARDETDGELEQRKS
jgi:hypothetical protein